MLPLISFQTGRKTLTPSSVKTTRWSETANGSLVLSRIGTPAESPRTRRRIRKNLHPRSSAARRESFGPLDKDLSWKSGYRKVVVGLQVSGNRVYRELRIPFRLRGCTADAAPKSGFRADSELGVTTRWSRHEKAAAPIIPAIKELR